MLGSKSIDYFFNPKTIAIIGASNSKGKVGYTIFENMKKASSDCNIEASKNIDEQGNITYKCVEKIFPINPKHKEIQGIKAYPSIKEINQKIDLAVISLPAKFVPIALEECISCKVKAVIIVSAGFSEVGEKKLTEKIKKLIDENPETRVMGPNCVGVMSTYSGVDTTFFERSRMRTPKQGSLSFISQSGALGSMILDWVATQEFGINKFASYGNAMDIDEADLIEHFGEDKKTKVITAYLEGARNGRKFFEIAKKTSLKKPIIVLKGSRNEKTREAAMSHTSSLAGAPKVYDAVFRQAGIIQAEDLLDLFNIAKLLEKEPLPKGNRVQIITNGGGFGIITADQIVEQELELAKLSKKSIEKLKNNLPGAIISNPIDLLGDATIEDYKKAIETSLGDKNVDLIIILVLFNLPTIQVKNILSLKKAREKSTKPIVVCSIGSDYTEKYMHTIEKAGFCTMNYPSVAAKALKAMVAYSEFLKKN